MVIKTSIDHQSKVGKESFIHIGYILGVSLLLASIIYLTMIDIFEIYGTIFNFIYIFIVAGSFYYLIKKVKDRLLVILLTLATAAYVFIQFVHWMIRHYSEAIFLSSILLVFAIVIANIYVIKFLKKKWSHGNEEKPWWQKLLVGVVSGMSSIIVTAASEFF